MPQQSLIQFLKTKTAHYRIGELVYSQWEAFCLWCFDGIPGFPGFLLRNCVFRMLFKDIEGFALVQPRVTFVHTDRLSVGRMLGINSGSYLNAVGTIRLGNYVLMGTNVTISSGAHPIGGRSPEIFARPVEPAAIVIEDDVWIGAGAVIMPGVTLRKGTVVGANSVVTRSTEEYDVVVGAPARKVSNRLQNPSLR